MAGIDVIEESHYDGRGDETNIIKCFSFSDLIWIQLKLCGVPVKKQFYIKEQLTLALTLLNGFSPGDFYKLFITHNKSDIVKLRNI